MRAPIESHVICHFVRTSSIYYVKLVCSLGHNHENVATCTVYSSGVLMLLPVCETCLSKFREANA